MPIADRLLDPTRLGPPSVASSRFKEGPDFCSVAALSSNLVPHSQRESEQGTEAIDVCLVSVWWILRQNVTAKQEARTPLKVKGGLQHPIRGPYL